MSTEPTPVEALDQLNEHRQRYGCAFDLRVVRWHPDAVRYAVRVEVPEWTRKGFSRKRRGTPLWTAYRPTADEALVDASRLLSQAMDR